MDNKGIIKEFFNQLWIERNVSVIDEIMTPQTLAKSFACTGHIDTKTLKDSTIEWLSLFADDGGQPVSLVHSDDRFIIANILQHTKHEQAFLSMAPTGKPLKIPLSVACVFNAQQKIIDYKVHCNFIEVVKQIQPDNMAQTLAKLKQPIFDWLSNTKAEYQSLIRKLRVINRGGEVLKFTPRQLECLSLWLHAKTSKEIGQILAISVTSTNTYLDMAKATLRCDTKSQAYEQLDNLNTIHLFHALYKKLVNKPDKHFSNNL